MNPISFVILAFVLFFFGCSDTYRYPCQNPQNWGKPECEPPQCEASGTCTKDLVSKDVYERFKKKNP